MVDIFNTAVKGLNAFRAALNTTGQNVANVNTRYYSRQRVELGTSPPEKQSYGYMGTGVDIQSVTRSIDEFVMKQLRGHTSGVSQYEHLNDLTSQMSALLGDTEVGLTPDLEAFFGAMQDLADSPASIPARQVFLDEAETLTTRIQDINSALSDLRDAVDTGITNAVTAINNLATGIAGINRAVAQAADSATNPPNDLLDDRDRMLVDLSKLAGIQVVTQKDGSLNVFLNNGQPLVVGNTTQKLLAVQSGFDPQEITVRLEGQAEGSDLERYITSGELGGYFEFRRTILNPAQDGLGLLAIGVAETFNEQHQQGMDLDGALGENLFNIGSPRVLSHSKNDGNALFSADLNNTAGVYELSYDGDYTLTRLSDGVKVKENFSLDDDVPLIIDGVSIEKNAGAVVIGDRFLLQPSAQGSASSALSTAYNGNTSAASFESRAITTTDSSQLVRSDYEILTSGVASRASYTNAGTATISAPTIIDDENENLTNNVKITFSGAGNYTLVDGTTTVSGAYNPAGTDISHNGWKVKISGAFTLNDSFEISAGYTVTRQSDDQEILSNGDLTALKDVMREEGLRLELQTAPPYSPPRYEDRFLIQPTRNVAPSFELNISDPRKIAAAAPITTAAWADNVGSAAISAGTVVDADNPNLQNTIRIQFTSANTFDVLDLTAGTTLATNVNYASGGAVTYNGWSANITGSPQGGVSGKPIAASANPTNQGTATIAVTAPPPTSYNVDLLNKVEIRFTSATQYNVFDIAKGTTLASGVNYTSNGNISYNGWTAQITDGASTPQAGDVFQIKSDGDAFVIKNNQGGYGDNRNALELVKLETKQQLMGGNDYRGVYAQLIAETGAAGRRVENTLQSQEALLEQSTLTRESISGVNLDEEAANLMRFQQAYEASAQMIQTANSLFNALLDAVGG